MLMIVPIPRTSSVSEILLLATRKSRKKLGQELSELTKTETGKVSAEKKRESVVERAPVKKPVKKVPKSRKKLRLKAAR